jgi:hypothetical protein
MTGKVIGVLHVRLTFGHGTIINLGIDSRNLKQLRWVHFGFVEA